MKGVKENDYAMIIGFPGRTTRFMSSEEAKETQNINNAISIYVRGEKQKIWMADMEADPKVRIQYSSKYSGSSNGWMKWIGMNETFGKLNVVERRAAEEKAFNEWVAADPKRVEKYGNAVEPINNAIKERAEVAYVTRYLNESLSSIELVRAPMMAVRPGALAAFFKDYSVDTDRKLAKKMIAIYKEKGTHLGILFCVPVFILSGFEHSIANMFYFGASGKIDLDVIIYLVIVIIGNAIGGVFLPLLSITCNKEKKNG